MEKKAYITPAIKVVSLNLTRVVLTTISGGDTKIVSSDIDDESYEQRSRRFDWSDDEW